MLQPKTQILGLITERRKYNISNNTLTYIKEVFQHFMKSQISSYQQPPLEKEYINSYKTMGSVSAKALRIEYLEYNTVSATVDLFKASIRNTSYLPIICFRFIFNNLSVKLSYFSTIRNNFLRKMQ